MFMLSTFTGHQGSFIILSQYLVAIQALTEITYVAKKLAGEQHTQLHAFLDSNHNIILYQDADGWKVNKNKCLQIVARDFEEFGKKIIEITNDVEGYWMLMNCSTIVNNSIVAWLAPLDAIIDESDYRRTKYAIRYHTITNLLEEL